MELANWPAMTHPPHVTCSDQLLGQTIADRLGDSLLLPQDMKWDVSPVDAPVAWNDPREAFAQPGSGSGPLVSPGRAASCPAPEGSLIPAVPQGSTRQTEVLQRPDHALVVSPESGEKIPRLLFHQAPDGPPRKSAQLGFRGFAWRLHTAKGPGIRGEPFAHVRWPLP